MNTIVCMSEKDRKQSLDTIVTPLFEPLNDKPTGETIYVVHCNDAWVTGEMINAFLSSEKTSGDRHSLFEYLFLRQALHR